MIEHQVRTTESANLREAAMAAWPLPEEKPSTSIT